MAICIANGVGCEMYTYPLTGADMKAGKMGAMAKPIKATATWFVTSDGFQISKAAPSKAPPNHPGPEH